MPERQSKRGGLWLNDGSCLRVHPDGAAVACTFVAPGPWLDTFLSDARGRSDREVLGMEVLAGPSQATTP